MTGSAMAFDTQRAARRLTDAGLDDRAAQGVADIVDSATSGLATESSLLELRADLLSFRAELKGDIHSLRAEMYRTIWMQGAGIIAATAAIVGIATALG